MYRIEWNDNGTSERKGYDEESTNNQDMHIQTENKDEQLKCYFISCLTFEMICLDDTSFACCSKDP